MTGAPYIFSPLTTRRIMLQVIIALLPLVAVALAAFGLRALVLVTTAVAGCVTFEYLGARFLLHRPAAASDLSAVVTGLLLALWLPAGFPLWMVLLGCFFAVIVVKTAFGGIGCNLFNPALAALVFLFLSFPGETSACLQPHWFDFFSDNAQKCTPVLEKLKYLSWESLNTSPESYNLAGLPDFGQMLKETTCGNLGNITFLAVLPGLIWLLSQRIISWQIPFYYLMTFFILVLVHWLINGTLQNDIFIHFFSGSLWLGAVFMATDYTTSPMSARGKIIFASGCGILTGLIRLYGIYPDGVPFAILLMNAFVPLLDKICTPRIYGTPRR